MSTPEKPTSAPAAATKSPSDALLRNFKTTLEKRWAEFDSATMKEAQFQVKKHPLGGFTDAQTERSKNTDFIKAKAAFDQARISLSAVQDDIGLKQILNSPGNLLSAIQTLEAHFAAATAPEKAKEYNHVLADTLADLTSLKSQVTNTAEDKKSAEIAAAAVTTLALTTGDAMGKITGGLTDAIGDGVKDLSKETEGFKKNPMKKIADFFGFNDTNIVSEIKEALTKKKSGGFDGFFATLKLWFYGLMGKMTGVDLAKSLTSEEMKIAGIKGKIEAGKMGDIPKEGIKNETEKFLSAKSYDMTSKLLIYGVSREKFDTALGGAISAMKDATWGLDDVQKKEATMSSAIVTLGLAKVQEKSWGQLKSLGESGILSLLGQSKPEEKSAVKLILDMMNGQESRFDKVFQGIDWKNLSLKSLLARLYKKEGYDKVEVLTDVIKDFDPKKMVTLSGELFTKIGKNQNGEYTVSGILGSQYESLKSQGIGVVFLEKVLSTEKGTQSISTFLGNMRNEDFSENERVFLEKVFSAKYLDGLKESLKNRFGFTDELIGQMSSDKIRVKDVFELYAITGGDTDVSKLDKGRKALLFTKMQMYLGNKDANALGKYLLMLTKDGAQNYPDAVEIGNMIDSTVNYGIYKSTFIAINGGEKLLDGLLGAVDIDTQNRILKSIGLTGGMTGLIWLAIKLTPVGRVASRVAILLGSLGLGAVTAAQTVAKK